MKVALLLLLAITPILAADKPLKKCEFNFKLRGYAIGYSKQTEGFGGNATSSNFPKLAPENLLTKETLLFDIDPTTRALEDTYEGLTLRLVNATKKEVIFNACDSRLPIIQEAQDEIGIWREIELWPTSECGSSYHTLQLAPKEYWEFVVPKYSGPIKTKLRFKLLYGKGDLLYSDTFEGSVHPEQFIISTE